MALRGSDRLGGVAFIVFGIVIVGVGVAVLLVSDVLFGVAIIGVGVVGIGFGVYMLTNSGRMQADSAASVEDYDGQEDVDAG